MQQIIIDVETNHLIPVMMEHWDYNIDARSRESLAGSLTTGKSGRGEWLGVAVV